METRWRSVRRRGVDTSGVQVVLFSRPGFAPELRAAAAAQGIRLVDVDRLAADLEPG